MNSGCVNRPAVVALPSKLKRNGRSLVTVPATAVGTETIRKASATAETQANPRVLLHGLARRLESGFPPAADRRALRLMRLIPSRLIQSLLVPCPIKLLSSPFPSWPWGTLIYLSVLVKVRIQFS